MLLIDPYCSFKKLKTLVHEIRKERKKIKEKNISCLILPFTAGIVIKNKKGFTSRLSRSSRTNTFDLEWALLLIAGIRLVQSSLLLCNPHRRVF